MDDIAIPSDIPIVQRRKKISHIKNHQGGLLVAYLEDGTILQFNHNQLISLGRIPRQGDTVKLSFQRHPSDRSSNPSQISRIELL